MSRFATIARKAVRPLVSLVGVLALVASGLVLTAAAASASTTTLTLNVAPLWTQGTVLAGEYPSTIAFGNGVFVATSSDSVNAVAYSTNGITWTDTTMPATGSWVSPAFGDGQFVSVDPSTADAAYSTNGITWTEATLPASGNWVAVTYGGGEFVAITGLGAVAYSTNGITWSSASMPSGDSGWDSLAYGNGEFVSVADQNGDAAYSANGITWTAATIPAYGASSVTYGAGNFVALGGSSPGSGMYSSNGISWTAMSLPSTAQWGLITYGDGEFFALTSEDTPAAATSPNGISWTSTTPPADGTQFWALAYGNEAFAAIEPNGTTAVLAPSSAPAVSSTGNAYLASLDAPSDLAPTGTLTVTESSSGTCSTSTWSNAGSDGGSGELFTATCAISSAENSGATITAAYTGTDYGPLSSNTLGISGAPSIGSASITGLPRLGTVLTAVSSGVTGYPTPTETYQWYDGSTAIVGATSSTYTVQSSDMGDTIHVVITETNGVGSPASATSASTITADAAPTITAATITGTPMVGDTLTATSSGVTGYPTPTETYQWYYNLTPIQEATSSTYTIPSAYIGDSISVVITEFNGVPNTPQAWSAGTSDVTNMPGAPTIEAATITGTSEVGQTLTATATGVTGTPTPTETYQWFDDSSAITGAASSTYTVQGSDLGESISVAITETNGVGSPATATSDGTSGVTTVPTGGGGGSDVVGSAPPTSPPQSPPTTTPQSPPITSDATTSVTVNLGFAAASTTLSPAEMTTLTTVAKSSGSGATATISITSYAKNDAPVARARANRVATYFKARTKATVKIRVVTTKGNKVTVVAKKKQ
jgi:hypothetical protein